MRSGTIDGWVREGTSPNRMQKVSAFQTGNATHQEVTVLGAFCRGNKRALPRTEFMMPSNRGHDLGGVLGWRRGQTYICYRVRCWQR